MGLEIHCLSREKAGGKGQLEFESRVILPGDQTSLELLEGTEVFLSCGLDNHASVEIKGRSEGIEIFNVTNEDSCKKIDASSPSIDMSEGKKLLVSTKGKSPKSLSITLNSDTVPSRRGDSRVHPWSVPSPVPVSA